MALSKSELAEKLAEKLKDRAPDINNLPEEFPLSIAAIYRLQQGNLSLSVPRMQKLEDFLGIEIQFIIKKKPQPCSTTK